jgi:hypothetical protein
MFILVAIQTKIFPVGAIGGIVVGIAILVMHRQLVPVLMGEFSPALGANHAVDLQGSVSVAAFRFHSSTP